MKRTNYIGLLFSCAMLSFCGFIDAIQLRVPQSDLPGLLIPEDAIPLSQSDFISGSYRISKPGYYYFVEDVFFNPDPIQEQKRTDKPQIGAWFTALSIECDNVVIDLNKKTFAAHEDFLQSQKLKVFSLIEFGNSPFPLAKFPFFAYTGATTPVFASNVIVKNGTIGASPHHGLHGNSNSNIQIYDLVISDWEVAGIAFNGLKSGVIRNVTITGLEHAMDFTGLVSVMLAVKVVLEDLRDAHADVNAQGYIDALQSLIDNPAANGSIHPTRLNYGNVYGIFLNRAFDIGPVAQQVTAQHSNAIIIENVLIANITSQLLETVAIGNLNGQTMMAELFGTFRWEDAYPQGTFAPNALLKAQVYAQKQRAPEKMPAGFADNILSAQPREEIFLSHARPVFGLDFPGHANKGIFGIRVDAGYGVSIKNCSVMGLNNLGASGKKLTQIPAGTNYTFPVARYAGNDVHGISLAVCRNCTVTDCDVSECSSKNGNVYGIALRNNANANQVQGCVISNLSAARDDEKSAVNPSSQVYGVIIDTQVHANRVIDSRVHTLEAPRYVYGICAHDATDTLIHNSTVSHLTGYAKSTKNSAKEVAGCASLASYATRIENSTVRVLTASGEDAATATSNTVAAGYLLGDATQDVDLYAAVVDSSAECIDAGAGVAAGILLANAQQFTVMRNTLAYTLAKNQYGFGYGIYNALGKEGTGFVVQNYAYGNRTKNYEPSGARWPLLNVTNSSLSTVQNQTGLYNLAFAL